MSVYPKATARKSGSEKSEKGSSQNLPGPLNIQNIPIQLNKRDLRGKTVKLPANLIAPSYVNNVNKQFQINQPKSKDDEIKILLDELTLKNSQIAQLKEQISTMTHQPSLPSTPQGLELRSPPESREIPATPDAIEWSILSKRIKIWIAKVSGTTSNSLNGKHSRKVYFGSSPLRNRQLRSGHAGDKESPGGVSIWGGCRTNGNDLEEENESLSSHHSQKPEIIPPSLSDFNHDSIDTSVFTEEPPPYSAASDGEPEAMMGEGEGEKGGGESVTSEIDNTTANSTITALPLVDATILSEVVGDLTAIEGVADEFQEVEISNDLAFVETERTQKNSTNTDFIPDKQPQQQQQQRPYSVDYQSFQKKLGRHAGSDSGSGSSNSPSPKSSSYQSTSMRLTSSSSTSSPLSHLLSSLNASNLKTHHLRLSSFKAGDLINSSRWSPASFYSQDDCENAGSNTHSPPLPAGRPTFEHTGGVVDAESESDTSDDSGFGANGVDLRLRINSTPNLHSSYGIESSPDNSSVGIIDSLDANNSNSCMFISPNALAGMTAATVAMSKADELYCVILDELKMFREELSYSSVI